MPGIDQQNEEMHKCFLESLAAKGIKTVPINMKMNVYSDHERMLQNEIENLKEEIRELKKKNLDLQLREISHSLQKHK